MVSGGVGRVVAGGVDMCCVVSVVRNGGKQGVTVRPTTLTRTGRPRTPRLTNANGKIKIFVTAIREGKGEEERFRAIYSCLYQQH